MTTVIDMKSGISETDQYKAWKFAGGEVHLKLKNIEAITDHDFILNTRLNTSDDIIFLILMVDTVKKTWEDAHITVFIPYMPYQQADRDFSEGECFSLKTITTILNSLPVNKFIVFDSHSDVTPALLKNCYVRDNHAYIDWVIRNLTNNDVSNLVILSPDAGAYKKIFKLATHLHFQGDVATANKSRSISTGNIDSVEISKQDFEGKNVLIIDDICIGGRTFVELAKKLRERNVGNLYLAVSHGIFSNGFSELGKYFERVFTTNSRRDSYQLYGDGMITVGDFLPDNFLTVYQL
jgi:ribose-phosphate pyrophosphokinase